VGLAGTEAGEGQGSSSQMQLPTIQGSPTLPESSASPGARTPLSSVAEELGTPPSWTRDGQPPRTPSVRSSDPGDSSGFLFAGVDAQDVSHARFLASLGPRASPAPQGSSSESASPPQPRCGPALSDVVPVCSVAWRTLGLSDVVCRPLGWNGNVACFWEGR
jgi:hypothetical protein